MVSRPRLYRLSLAVFVACALAVLCPAVQVLSTINDERYLSMNAYFYDMYVKFTVGDSDVVVKSVSYVLTSDGGGSTVSFYTPDAEGKPSTLLGTSATQSGISPGTGAAIFPMTSVLRLHAHSTYLVSLSSNGGSVMMYMDDSGFLSIADDWSIDPINRILFEHSEWWEDYAIPMLALDVTPLAAVQTYGEWASRWFTPAELKQPKVSGATADPGGVGLPNLLRYAFALPPHGPVAPPVAAEIVTEGNRRYAALRFPVASSGSDLEYTVEASDALASWTPLTTFNVGMPPLQPVRDSIALETAPRRFLRVNVVLKP